MRYAIHLRPPDGEAVVYRDPCDYDDDGTVEYLWTEGNYSCDCNRSAFLGLPQMPCGETIELLRIVREDGREVV